MLLLSLLGLVGTASAVSVVTSSGTIVGTTSSVFQQDFFLGVPYASSTRFAPSTLISNPASVSVPATDYGDSCYGFGLDQALFPQSEDCLNLNIVRPTPKTGPLGINLQLPLPVAVYFYGGAFRTGTASRHAYNLSFPVNASQVLKTPIIAVSVNYRVNAFGFISSSQVQSAGALNLGLKDQRNALIWIKNNIRKFGGDPNRITIWGQSAGAQSVAAHLLAYDGRNDGLFHRAIQQSGSATSGSFYPPNESIYENAYNTLLAHFSCSDLNCLKAVPTADFVAALNPANNIISVTWGPVIDGDFIKRSASEQLAQGKFVKVPVLAGTNNDEGTFFAAYGFNAQAASSARIRGQFPRLTGSPKLDALQALYPPNPSDYPLYPPTELGSTLNNNYPWSVEFGSEYKRLATILGDLVFIAPRRAQAVAWSKNFVPFYSYRFAAEANSYRLATPAPWGPQYGVTHNSDIPYFFDNPYDISTGNWGGQTPADVHLREYLSRSLISFVNFGTPNINGLGFSDIEDWKLYNFLAPKNLFVGVNLTATPPTVVSFTEPDTWRSTQINYINNDLITELAH